MAALPSWVAVQPDDFVKASEAGTRAGLESSRIRQEGELANQRIAQTAIARQQEQQQDEARMAMQARQQQAQLEMESKRLDQAQVLANLEAQTRKEIAQQNSLKEQQRIEISKAYHNTQTDLAKQRLAEVQAVNAAKARDAAMRFAAQQDFAGRLSRGEAVDKALFANPALVTPQSAAAVSRVAGSEGKMSDIDKARYSAASRALLQAQRDISGNITGASEESVKAVERARTDMDQIAKKYGSTTPEKQKLTPEKAREFLKESKGDRAKAEAAAKAAGFTW